MDNYHIKPHQGGWAFAKEGEDRPLGVYPMKVGAIEHMRRYMEGRTGSVKIHTADGRIEEERTYPRSADPRRSPG